MITCTRVLEFDAAHRVMNHESKCATLHGHRYKVEITAQANSLDSVGRVIDFSVLKSLVGHWLDENWDHTTIVYEKDREVLLALWALPRVKEPFASKWNPTAENMANFLLQDLCPDLLEFTGIRVVKVVVHETPNCFATAVLDESEKPGTEACKPEGCCNGR